MKSYDSCRTGYRMEPIGDRAAAKMLPQLASIVATILRILLSLSFISNRPDTQMAATYDREELNFQYPENWQLDEDPSQGVPRTVSVTAKDGSYWSVTICPAEHSSEDLKKEYLETFQTEYEDLEMDPVEVKVGDRKFDALDLQFYCLDFLVHSRLLVATAGEYRLLIAWQAEDREFDKLSPVFEAITFSAIS